MATESQTTPRCRKLVLDAGPLLSLSPLRGLAETYLTVPQVLEELKDKRAREHFERLGLSAGVRIEVRSPDAASLAHVIQFAKKTGDYSVLSHADLCILALTYSLDKLDKEEALKASEEKTSTSDPSSSNSSPENPKTSEQAISELSEDLSNASIRDGESSSGVAANPDAPEHTEETVAESYEHDLEPLNVELHPAEDDTHVSSDSDNLPTTPTDPEPIPSSSIPPKSSIPPAPVYDDPSDSDDGEGEWITPSNVALHKSRALDLLPAAGQGKGKARAVVGAGCMTADFAMQNVLLQMGLALVGVEGKKIEKLKSWVLRCHACFKICKDNSKKFCPSCGNPTLLRASVTISAPGAASDAPVMQIHLKPNFQYKTRGTIYSIPAPKPGSAKKGPGEGLILREDQTEYLRAKKHADGKHEREEARMVKGLIAKGGEGGVSVGSWMDPDWMPEIISAGPSGKGRTVRSGGRDGDMPVIGYGRKNPNERKRRK
ncbi:hypothetical protein PLICRDRAFT_197945 [Plicaturopsis crispa FD-325 SS-3]|nr:hypothetical protein PLICRDRAFT_197945 [Plicaturopsis crispa FD-325 SS-3]